MSFKAKLRPGPEGFLGKAVSSVFDAGDCGTGSANSASCGYGCGASGVGAGGATSVA